MLGSKYNFINYKTKTMDEKLVTDQLPTENSEAIETQLPVIDSNEETLSPEVSEETVADEVSGELEVSDPTPEGQLDQEEPQEPQEELTELEKLTQRRTGFWQVNLQEPDVKWIKNSCNGKFEFTGPNEAFMLMNCFLGFSSAHARMAPANGAESQPCVVQASAIEACGYFMNRVSGNNMEAAQRAFRIAMALNPIIMEMRNLDTKIQELRAIEEEQKKAEPAPTENPEPAAE